MVSPNSTLTAAAQLDLVELRLIATTDLHLHLFSWDYFADCPREGLGLVAAASAIAKARAEVPNSLLLDNGDFLQGTPMGDLLAGRFGAQSRSARLRLFSTRVHPQVVAMNALTYDAVTLGNHEFNYGLDFLLEALAGLACPVVSANLALSLGPKPQKDRHLVRPWVLLERSLTDRLGRQHPIRIGILGFAPPQVVIWDSHYLRGRLFARDIVEAASVFVRELREAGADLVVALAHTGIGAADHSIGMENAAIPLAQLAGIDALILGHNHLLFPGPHFAGLPLVDAKAGTIADRPAVMAGCFGRHIGLVDLALARDGKSWRVLGSRSHLRAVEPDALTAASDAVARLNRLVGPAHRATRAAIARPIGQISKPLHSYFVHLGQTDALDLIARAQAWRVRQALAGSAWEGLPILSAAAPFKTGGRAGPQGYTEVPAGPIALRHISDLYPFPNALAAVRLTGAAILEWLERAASAWNQIIPGSQDTPLRDPAVPGHQFEVIAPLEVLFDLTAPARYDAHGMLKNPDAHRVVEVRYAGRPLPLAADFILATNSFRLGGAGGYLDSDPDIIVSELGPARDAVADYLASAAAREAEDQAQAYRAQLRFAPIPNTTALYKTGPAALAYLDDIAAFKPEVLGLTNEGFLILRVDLSGDGDQYDEASGRAGASSA